VKHKIQSGQEKNKVRLNTKYSQENKKSVVKTATKYNQDNHVV